MKGSNSPPRVDGRAVAVASGSARRSTPASCADVRAAPLVDVVADNSAGVLR
ncbi:hypothetical protein STRIP9103_03194 [Streptomyces ipomoeae 91-03]|uniref:Uncharacterized protein n=1 Tax=Streptomyces ipomoeae 91-03 TaxID=698759 RepID=L1L5G9_9ACTN|nr:hypothetical protein STRIP9103_03194 [Streptomyces ipomoeae 91-03]